MPAEERLEFSVDPYLPPYLLGFRGTAGERHVENLKVSYPHFHDKLELTLARCRSSAKSDWTPTLPPCTLEISTPTRNSIDCAARSSITSPAQTSTGDLLINLRHPPSPPSSADWT